MASLDSQDGTSSSQVVFVDNGCGSSKVARNRISTVRLVRGRPTYAETPTPSSMLDRVTNDKTSVDGKVYFSSTVGVILAAVRASERNLTWVCSST